MSNPSSAAPASPEKSPPPQSDLLRSSSREPRLGDRVIFTQFRGNATHDETGRKHLALITKVWTDGKVNLTVFHDHGTPAAKPYVARDDSRNTPDTWSYPEKGEIGD